MITPENKEKYLIKTFDFDNYENTKLNVFVNIIEEKIIFELIAKIKLEGIVRWRVLYTKEHQLTNEETINNLFEDFVKKYKEKIEFLELIVNFFDNIDSIELK